MKKKKTSASYEYDYWYGVKQERQPRQLIYLAISFAVIFAAFVALILL